jgi:alpha-L-rhamnosidase
MKLSNLTCLNRKNPLGIGDHPYFSWIMESDEQNVKQNAYRLAVRNDAGEVMWDTGMVESRHSAFIPYQGAALESRTVYDWTVTVQDNYGDEDTAVAKFETAILRQDEWQAQWAAAEPGKKHGKRGRSASLFRKNFTLKEKPLKARVYATAHGVYRLTVNGERADDREFAPEFTIYEKRLYFQTYDVTGLLNKGKNVLGITVADGWYFGSTTKQTFPGFDKRHCCLWQLEVTYTGGAIEIISSDGSVKNAQGGVVSSDLFHGETYDANHEPSGWDTPDFNDANWKNAETANPGFANLVPQEDAPVKAVMTLPVKEILRTPNGETVLDFGQNFAGRVRMKIDIPKGAVALFEHSETLDKRGNYFNNILGINQKDIFISAGKPACFEAAFTFHGFRYVRVSGIKNIRKEDFSATVLSTDAPWTGFFECSDEKINRLIENTRWGQRSNMLSIPTDCPQREKMGWTGDMTVYSKTALLNQDLSGLITRWLESLALVQLPDGQVPIVAPWPDFYKLVNKITIVLLGGSFKDCCSAGWGDAAVVVPWALYQATGNTTILEKQYPSMKAWVEYVRKEAASKRPVKDAASDEIEQYLWDTGFHFGEWLIPSCTEHGSMSAAVRKSAIAGRRYIAPVYFYMSCKILACAAKITGQDKDTVFYDELAGKIKDAYQKSMINPDGTLKIDVQGAYALAFGTGLVPEALREKAASRLAQLIHDNGDRLDTGFLATPFLLDALSDNGQTDLAYTLLFQNQRPGWMFEVDKGATTIWENWNSEDDHGNVQKISLNHYSFGCIADWIYRKIGGMENGGTGYDRIIIRPEPDRRITWAKREYRSPYGNIFCQWDRQEGRFRLRIHIPCNTEATVTMPDGTIHTIGSGKYQFESEDYTQRTKAHE